MSWRRLAIFKGTHVCLFLFVHSAGGVLRVFHSVVHGEHTALLLLNGLSDHEVVLQSSLLQGCPVLLGFQNQALLKSLGFSLSLL